LSTLQKQRRSLALDLAKYNTDKISNRYLSYYDDFFADRADDPITLLELGVKDGGSVELWRDYFPRGSIAGIDRNLANLSPSMRDAERIQTFEGSQGDPDFLTSVASKVAPEGFNFIIDDASHRGDLSRISFWHLFENHLKPGGVYAIEDWTTGYWDDWSDGRTFRPRSAPGSTWLGILKKLGIIARIPSDTHTYGMVGFLKELIDEQGATDLTRRLHSQPHGRASRFSSVTVFPAIAFVRKAESASVPHP
jgi:hypothetical protein